MSQHEDITRMLEDLSAGRTGAEAALLPLIYDELRGLARHYMRFERPGHTLQTTALVHEAYLKLGGNHGIEWEGRNHFLRLAAQAMRRILIDHARKKRSLKKGGDREREPLDKAVEIFEKSSSVDLVDLDSTLNRLGRIEQQLVRIVELRFFGGFTVAETAEILGISKTTVKTDWTLARAWLKQQMS